MISEAQIRDLGRKIRQQNQAPTAAQVRPEDWQEPPIAHTQAQAQQQQLALLQQRALLALTVPHLRLNPNGTLERAQAEPERDTHDEWRELNDG